MTESTPLAPQRRFIQPLPGDDIDAIAAREMPDVPLEEAKQQLQSWNLHVFLMRRPPGLITGSDIIFVEAPLVDSPMTMLRTED